MKPIAIGLFVTVAAAPLLAQETRELGAHVHGTSQVQIAVENNTVDIALQAPGMDIVGFEYEATTDADKAAVTAAIAALMQADLVITLDPAAGCTVQSTEAALHGADDAHSDHDHDHDHDDSHDHDHDHDHDDSHDHDHAKEESGHSEFEAQYQFTCMSTAALGDISFPFFQTFPNATEIKVEYIADVGAGVADVTRDAPDLTLN